MTLDRPDPGVATELEPGLRRILAANPSPMTHWGTNTYVIGTRQVAIVDPGPDDPAHLNAILSAVSGAEVAHILLTHAHLDHSPLARQLSTSTGAPILAFGPAVAGRRKVMTALAAAGLTGGGEGVDHDFRPDQTISDGETVSVEGIVVEALHTPGHMAGHLAFAAGDAVMTGDHVMGWASTLISPPDGDLSAFMESCARLRAREYRVYYPGHGAQIDTPADRLDWLIAHRIQREAAILSVLGDSAGSPAEVAARVYTDIDPHLMPAATRNVFAHLIDLHERHFVSATPHLALTATFTLL